MIFEKLLPKQNPVRCFHHPSAFCSELSKMKIKQEQEEVLSCHGHAILLNAVVNDKRYNQSLGLRRTKYFFLILRRVILKDHDALFLTDEVTLHEKMTFHFSREIN